MTHHESCLKPSTSFCGREPGRFNANLFKRLRLCSKQSFSQTTVTTVATGCPPSSFTAQTQLASALALSENCGNTPKIHWFIITFSIPIATLDQMLVVFWLVQINRTIIYDRGWTVRLLESRKRLNTIQSRFIHIHMGVSENSVPLNPLVNDHYPY